MPVQPLPTNFTAIDLFAWHEEGSLELSPKFQRRAIWKPAARGFFIDTILRGFPVPPLHIRMVAPRSATRARREVIDGQQRLRALFDFMQGRLRISRSLHSPWAGMTIDDLDDDHRDLLRIAPFPVYQYQAIDDATVLEIFARLNTYSVALTAQELRNGKYFGEFKTLVYDLAWRYLDFWRAARIFTEAAIARMAEAELVSELLVLQFDGFQDKKTSLDIYYAGLDEKWPSAHTSLPARKGRVVRPRAWLTREDTEERFVTTMSVLAEGVGDLIPTSPFRRVPLFYTLYSTVYHALFAVPGVDQPTQARAMSDKQIVSLRSAVEELTEVLSADLEDEAVPPWQRDFAIASARQTDNVGPRRIRFATLWEQADFR